MDTRMLDRLLRWMRTTDLIVIRFRAGGEGFELRLSGAAACSAPPFPASRLISVASPGVGVFRFSEPGRPREVEEGGCVTEGQRLGYLETGGVPVEILAPASGRLEKLLARDGGPVEYGQPLFLIAP